MNLKILAAPGIEANSLNPYSSLLYRAMGDEVEVTNFSWKNALRRRYDVFHIHWPEWELNKFRNPLQAFARLERKLRLIDALKLRGTKIVWTAHNLHAHDGNNAAIEARFWDRFTRRVDGVIALSRSSLEAAVQAHPQLRGKSAFVIPHGDYREAYASTSRDGGGDGDGDDRSAARQRIGLPADATVLLFFGLIRPYKEVERLLAAFHSLEGPHLRLVIAGRISDADLANRIKKAAAMDSRVLLKAGFVPEEAVSAYFSAADLVVLPYREILNSGTALLSLSLDRPALVPKLGSMGELQEAVGPNWIRTYEGALNSETLKDAVRQTEKHPVEGVAPLESFQWRRIGRMTVDAMRNLVNLRPVGGKELQRTANLLRGIEVRNG